MFVRFSDFTPRLALRLGCRTPSRWPNGCVSAWVSDSSIVDRTAILLLIFLLVFHPQTSSVRRANWYGHSGSRHYLSAWVATSRAAWARFRPGSKVHANATGTLCCPFDPGLFSSVHRLGDLRSASHMIPVAISDRDARRRRWNSSRGARDPLRSRLLVGGALYFGASPRFQYDVLKQHHRQPTHSFREVRSPNFTDTSGACMGWNDEVVRERTASVHRGYQTVGFGSTHRGTVSQDLTSLDITSLRTLER
nr:hypothetical protein CFP56_19543 [Quercus suber]